MIKVLLAQILFKPAIIERELDFLSEPGIYNYQLGKSFNSMVKNDIVDPQIGYIFREKYLQYFKNRLIQIVEWAVKRETDMLVFPEYSIPYQCLPDLYELSTENNITIIAGSHTVISACENYYVLSGMSEKIVEEHLGESISPIFFSKWKNSISV